MAIKNIKNYKILIRQMGLKWAFDRGIYEFQKKTGLLKRRNNFETIPEEELLFLLISKDKGNISKKLGNFFINQKKLFEIKSWLEKNLEDEEKEKIVKIADKALEGEIFCFSKWFANFGKPINWHKNPITGFQYNEDLHWTKINELIPGQDIKYVWEASRFPQVYYFIRAYLLTNDEKYVEGFWEQVEDWWRKNPLGYGPNWFCGQEVALRAMAWILAFFVFYNSPKSSPDRVLKMFRFLWAHGKRIEKNILFAIKILKNNHAISEAVGLYSIGLLFPFFKEGYRWRKKGYNYLIKEGLKQINVDGTFIQNSNNYHRMVLQLYNWALRLSELNNVEWDLTFKKRLEKSLVFLFSMQNETDGQLPNYGANDGSLPFILSSSGFNDYRPQLNNMWYLLRKEKLYQPGKHDEEFLWFFGENSKQKENFPEKGSVFEKGGYYFLRGNETWGMTRCTSYKNRPSHADMLHFDLWWKGKNVLADSGSYSYNNPPWDSFFPGSAAHNTVIINNQDQMRKWKRFSWLEWTKGKTTFFETNDKFSLFEGEHYGYKDIIHRRGILQREDIWFIVDDIFGDTYKEVEIKVNWVMGDFELKKMGKNQIKGIGNGGSFFLKFFNSKGSIYSLKKGVFRDGNIRGWLSRFYGEKEQVPSFQCEVKTKLPNRTITIFADCIDEKEIKFGSSTFEIKKEKFILGKPGDERIFGYIKNN